MSKEVVVAVGMSVDYYKATGTLYAKPYFFFRQKVSVSVPPGEDEAIFLWGVLQLQSGVQAS